MSYPECNITFGAVPIGVTRSKKFVFKNTKNNVVSYYVTRSMDTNPIYHVFDINKYEAKVEPGGTFVLRITYSPIIPGSKDFDYFIITTSLQEFYRLRFTGECIGPSLTCSVRNLIFYQTPKQKVKSQVFILENRSKVAATYQFDCDDEEIFRIEPKKGTLAPQEHEYITVKFVPLKPRLYSRELCCLILHHEPILLNLLGVYATTPLYDSPEINFRFFPTAHDERVSFKGYFSDSVTIKRVPPPVSLTINYLDFGRMLPESSCQTLTTSLTNHLESKVEVEWEPVKQFRIYPEKLEIPPQQSALYECRFRPEDSRALSWVLLNGQVSWTLSEYGLPLLVNAPIPINLRLIANSFPENQSWISSVSIIPNVIILPLTLPNVPSWCTFLIKTNGYLPVLYKLSPPRTTNFLMKPMVGLIRGFQIIAVQLESCDPEPKTYIEKWSIELNGQVQSCTEIYIKAQTDIPRIQVNVDNCIRFEAMQPGTQSNAFLPIRNVSFCQLQYEFLPTDKFHVDPSKGILAPNEEIFLTFWYTADKNENGLNQTEVICRVQHVHNDSIIGEDMDIPITVITEANYSELCALPQSQHYEEMELGQVLQTCFYLYNFGQANVNFKLSHDHNLKDVILNPIKATCGVNEKILIKIGLKIKVLGKNTLNVSYKNRVGKYADKVCEEGGKVIFRIKYRCVFPILQITELVEHNFGLFSNDSLWRFLRIDEINSALMESNQGEIKRVDLYAPDCEVSTKLFYLVFAIKNISSIYTKLDLKRRQVCDCKPNDSDESFTFRIKVYDCPHKQVFNMETYSNIMPPNFTSTITFKIKYILPGRNMLSYMMELSHDRTILLNIFIESIPDDTYILSVIDEDYRLNMGNVYVGLREAPVFAYWLYNNTNSAKSYKIDDLEITKLCNYDGFPVLQCLNREGWLQPYSSSPLMFKFWPIEVKTYKVSVPLQLGSKLVSLTIEGCGTHTKNKISFEKFSPIAKALRNNVIHVSVDSLMLEPVLTTNFTQRMFFIQNKSKTQEIKYSWRPCSINGLLKIEPLVMGGILKPKESFPVVIKIVSLSEPCRITILLCLEFIDLSEITEFEKSKADYKRRRSSTGEFVITETGHEETDEESDPELQYFTVALPITVNIVGASDRDICVFTEDQLKQGVWNEIRIDTDKFVEEYFERNKVKESPIHPHSSKTQPKEETNEPFINLEMTRNVLEQIVGDAVLSNSFYETLKNLKNEPSPLYSQIQFSSGENREEEIKSFFRQPQLSDVANICDEILLDGLQAMFQIGIIRDQKQNI